eukprot:2865145-Amphidinium_carterae.1
MEAFALAGAECHGKKHDPAQASSQTSPQVWLRTPAGLPTLALPVLVLTVEKSHKRGFRPSFFPYVLWVGKSFSTSGTKDSESCAW